MKTPPIDAGILLGDEPERCEMGDILASVVAIIVFVVVGSLLLKVSFIRTVVG